MATQIFDGIIFPLYDLKVEKEKEQDFATDFGDSDDSDDDDNASVYNGLWEDGLI